MDIREIFRTLLRIQAMIPITSADLHESAPGIFYTARPLVLIDQSLIAFVKQAAIHAPLRRARICVHTSRESEQHCMLIASARETYVAPHRHRGKSETFLVLEGKANVLLFEPDSRLADIVPMGPAVSGHPFFYQMPEDQYHSLMIDSEVLVFVETTKGPFRPEDTENAPWAPGPAETDNGVAFLAQAAKSYMVGR
jgi:cupin fold WbuC family metalloprotein